jgi:hypothetical protein
VVQSILNRARVAWGLAAAVATAAAVSATPAQAAPDVSLEVTHRSASLGADGIQRSTEFTERVLRRGDTVWVERVIPAGAHQENEHKQAKAGAAKDHKHADLSAATRWIQKGTDGKLKLKLVSAHDQVVVDIAPAEFATVGFDGAWPAAYHLIDPAVLQKLKPAGKNSEGQWFESPKADGANQVRVLWDAKLEVPLQVQTKSANGLSSRSTTVRVLKSADKAPWQATAGYATKDYSDFLD